MTDDGRHGGAGRHSVRVRLTGWVALLTALTFALTATGLLAAYRHTLLVQKKREIEKTFAMVTGRAQRPDLAVPLVGPSDLFTESVQVLDAAGRVISGDTASLDEPAMVTLDPGQASRETIVEQPTFRAADSAYVLAARIDTAAGERTVLVADSLDSVAGRVRWAGGLAAGGGVAVVALAAVFAWLLTGRTLRPVEQLRVQVSRITVSRDLSRRVPEPPGRDEISRLSGTLNRMLYALQTSSEAQQRFVADAAHELRTPLAGMTALLDVATGHPEAIESDQLVRRLSGATAHLSRVIDDLLTLAVLDAGRARGRARPVDLAGVAGDGLLHVDAGQIEVRARLTGRALVYGDVDQLTRVVINLLSNAVRHARSTVWVSLRIRSGAALLSVVDDGPGVPPADRDRVWDRFVRLDADRTRDTGGTGLGLALVREIVTRHGGEAWVADAPRLPGAAFHVRLPLHSPHR